MTDSQSVEVGSRAERSRQRKRQLLQVARQLLLEQGYERTSVSSIVRAAGVAQGTFYLYFKSKEQLLPYLRAEVLADYLKVFSRGSCGPVPPTRASSKASRRSTAPYVATDPWYASFDRLKAARPSS